MLIGPLLADLLAELLHPQVGDELRAEEDRDQHRRHAGDQHLAAVDDRRAEAAGELGEREGDHRFSPILTTSSSAIRSRPTDREPLIRATSPGSSSSSSSGTASPASATQWSGE